MGMNVFNAYGCFVHKNAHRQRQATERHDVDRLCGHVQRQHGAHQRERNVDHDNQGASPIAQKHQHHQAGQHCAESAFQRQPRDRTGNVG